MKFSKDGQVCFDPVTHTYKLGEKYLQSVTGLISKYKEPFDSDRIASAYALKHNLKKDEVLSTWKKEGEISCLNGSAVHTVFENYILTGQITDKLGYPKEDQAIEFIKDYFLTGKLVPRETEMIVYNENIATQIDCIAENKKGEFFILDWKTNKKIDSESFMQRKMLAPFDSYMDCNFIHYSIQVELCRLLCKEYKIKSCFIVHLDTASYHIIPSEKVIIPQSIL